MLVDTATKNKEWNTNSKEQVKADKKDAKNGSKSPHPLDTKSQTSSLSSDGKKDSASAAKAKENGKEKGEVTSNGMDKTVVPSTESTKTKVPLITPEHTVSHSHYSVSLHSIRCNRLTTHFAV